MTSEDKKRNPFLILSRILILAVLIAAVILSGKFAGFMDLYGLAFVLIGGIALILMSFTVREIAAAIRGSGGASRSLPENRKPLIFWECASRNFWMVGILATLIVFVMTMADSTGGIGGIATRMASALIPTVYGVILSVMCLVPAMKLRESQVSNPHEEITGESGKTDSGGEVKDTVEVDVIGDGGVKADSIKMDMAENAPFRGPIEEIA